MRLSYQDMRKAHLKSIADIKFKREQLIEIRKESAAVSPDLTMSGFSVVAKPNKPAGFKCCLVDDRSDAFVKQISRKVKERLEFSKYIVDPNRFNFSKVVRVVALVIKAVK